MRPVDQLGAERLSRRLRESSARCRSRRSRRRTAARRARARNPGIRLNDEQRERAARASARSTRATTRRRLARSATCPAYSDESDERQRLGQTHEAERQRVVRDVVDLPRDDDRLDLRGDGHRQQRDDEPSVVPNAKRGVRVVGHGAEKSNQRPQRTASSRAATDLLFASLFHDEHSVHRRMRRAVVRETAGVGRHEHEPRADGDLAGRPRAAIGGRGVGEDVRVLPHDRIARRGA